MLQYLSVQLHFSPLSLTAFQAAAAAAVGCLARTKLLQTQPLPSIKQYKQIRFAGKGTEAFHSSEFRCFSQELEERRPTSDVRLIETICKSHAFTDAIERGKRHAMTQKQRKNIICKRMRRAQSPEWLLQTTQMATVFPITHTQSRPKAGIYSLLQIFSLKGIKPCINSTKHPNCNEAALDISTCHSSPDQPHSPVNDVSNQPLRISMLTQVLGHRGQHKSEFVSKANQMLSHRHSYHLKVVDAEQQASDMKIQNNSIKS